MRGPIFRALITYHDIGTRPTIAITNTALIQQIEAIVGEKGLDIKDIQEIAEKLTTAQLSFTTAKASSDPNVLVSSKHANCIGYAAMYNSIATYLIEQNGLEDEYKVQHKKGKLDFLGIDLHQFSDSPFFKDHDFNVIKNRETQDVIAVDATVLDYLWVGKVSLE
ncbi:MAG: hypothetical protein AB8F78_14205 [Saprospiraceae bacterium]